MLTVDINYNTSNTKETEINKIVIQCGHELLKNLQMLQSI